MFKIIIFLVGYVFLKRMFRNFQKEVNRLFGKIVRRDNDFVFYVFYVNCNFYSRDNLVGKDGLKFFSILVVVLNYIFVVLEVVADDFGF